jgi:2-dehydropantoate 2-reductase
VLGPGGVGGFLAAALARASAGPGVTIVARAPTARKINRDGLNVRSAVLGEFVAHPSATTVLDQPTNMLFVATKATELAPALRRVKVTPDLVVPLLNGLEHMDLLRVRFGPDRVAAASIRIESERTGPGVIVQHSPQLRVELAADDPTAGRHLPAVATLLSDAGIPATICSSEKQVLWSKLVRLVALSATTAAFDEPLGRIRADPRQWEALTACVREAAAVAVADGARIDPDDTLAELSAAHPSLRSSLHRDIATGRESELDAIQGAVLRAAARHGLACPTIQRLAATIERRSV